MAAESSYDYDDLFNFEVSVAIAETETDEMNTEFSDAVNEIDGKKSFPCTLCEKVCKSKGGLTRHTNSKHSEGQRVLQDEVMPPFAKMMSLKL